MTKYSIPFAKVFFVLSILVFGVFYGIVAAQWNWFPRTQAQEVWKHAKHIIGPGHPGPILGPHVYERKGVTAKNVEKMEPGLTLITSWWEKSKKVKLIDNSGEVVHKWNANGNKIFPDSIDTESVPEKRVLHGTHLFPNGDLLINIEYTGTARLNSCGNVLWRLPETTHHSIAQSEGGSFWIPARKTDLSTPRQFPGYGKVNSLAQIIQVTKEGQVTDRINVLDILYSNDLQHFTAKFSLVESGSKTHLNDVKPLPDTLAEEYPLFERGDLVVSLRDANLVFVFDPKSGVVRWHSSSPFIRQHDPHFIGNGWIGIFDNRTDFTNRGTMLGGSRIVAIQPHTDSTRVLYPKSDSSRFYTSGRGKWQMLKNGNLLITEAQAGRVIEVTPGGSIVWEWIHPPYDGSVYSDSLVPAVTKATRVNLTREEVASWPCTSLTSTDPATQNR